MAKKKILNGLKIRKGLESQMFIGINGRYGFMSKDWKDFTKDELAEFWTAHDQKTRISHLEGYLHPDYVHPIHDEQAPLKPKTEDDQV